MIPLVHNPPTHPALNDFVATHPDADFDSKAFHPVKVSVRKDLHQMQDGLCVFCERQVAADNGEIAHIKPKSVHPELAFSFHNYAFGCRSTDTCGAKQKAGLLPIEPGPGCNDRFSVSTVDATIEPIAGLSRQQRHAVNSTCGMLGLNRMPLKAQRKDALDAYLAALQSFPDEADELLAHAPFRYILPRVAA